MGCEKTLGIYKRSWTFNVLRKTIDKQIGLLPHPYDLLGVSYTHACLTIENKKILYFLNILRQVTIINILKVAEIWQKRPWNLGNSRHE